MVPVFLYAILTDAYNKVLAPPSIFPWHFYSVSKIFYRNFKASFPKLSNDFARLSLKQ